jgi:hypothetical protein
MYVAGLPLRQIICRKATAPSRQHISMVWNPQPAVAPDLSRRACFCTAQSIEVAGDRAGHNPAEKADDSI